MPYFRARIDDGTRDFINSQKLRGESFNHAKSRIIGTLIDARIISDAWKKHRERAR